MKLSKPIKLDCYLYVNDEESQLFDSLGIGVEKKLEKKSIIFYNINYIFEDYLDGIGNTPYIGSNGVEIACALPIDELEKLIEQSIS